MGGFCFKFLIFLIYTYWNTYCKNLKLLLSLKEILTISSLCRMFYWNYAFMNAIKFYYNFRVVALRDLNICGIEREISMKIQTKESLLVEFKSYPNNSFNKRNKEKIVKEFVAIYNTIPVETSENGYIYIGIDDDGNIEGVSEDVLSFFEDDSNFGKLLSGNYSNTSGIDFNIQIHEQSNLKFISIEIPKKDKDKHIYRKDNILFVRYASSSSKFNFDSINVTEIKKFYVKKIIRTNFELLFLNYFFNYEDKELFLMKHLKSNEYVLIHTKRDNFFNSNYSIKKEEIIKRSTSKATIFQEIFRLYEDEKKLNVEEFYEKVISKNNFLSQYSNSVLNHINTEKDIKKGYYKFNDERFSEKYFNSWEQLLLSNPERPILHPEFESSLEKLGWIGDRNSDVINQIHKPKFVKELRAKINERNKNQNKKYALVSDLKWSNYIKGYSSNSRGGYCYTSDPDKISEWITNSAQKIKSNIFNDGISGWVKRYKKISNKEIIKKEIDDMLSSLPSKDDRELLEHIFKKIGFLG